MSPDWKCPLYRRVPKERFRCSKTNLNQGDTERDWPHILKLRGTRGTDKANDNKLMGDFRKKILQTDFERKRNPAKEWLCISRKKLYRQKFGTQTKPPIRTHRPQKSNGRPLIYAAMKYVTSFHGDTGPPASESAEARLCCHIG